MTTVKLRFSALPSHVRTARLVAAAVARRAGVEESVLDEVRLAVGEACSRAVGLHRRNLPDEPVVVTLIQDPGRFAVEVVDRVPPATDPAGSGLEAIEVIEEAAVSGAGDNGLAGAGAPAKGTSRTGASGGTAGPGGLRTGRDAAPREPLSAGGLPPDPGPGAVLDTGPPGGLNPLDDDQGDAVSGSMGLAVISGLVDDLVVRTDGDGAVIRMSWPTG
jgi:anti-sigma regulatory factor (Ser/Thr protein kinase)